MSVTEPWTTVLVLVVVRSLLRKKRFADCILEIFESFEILIHRLLQMFRFSQSSDSFFSIDGELCFPSDDRLYIVHSTVYSKIELSLTRLEGRKERSLWKRRWNRCCRLISHFPKAEKNEAREPSIRHSYPELMDRVSRLSLHPCPLYVKRRS